MLEINRAGANLPVVCLHEALRRNGGDIDVTMSWLMEEGNTYVCLPCITHASHMHCPLAWSAHRCP